MIEVNYLTVSNNFYNISNNINMFALTDCKHHQQLSAKKVQ